MQLPKREYHRAVHLSRANRSFCATRIRPQFSAQGDQHGLLESGGALEPDQSPPRATGGVADEALDVDQVDQNLVEVFGVSGHSAFLDLDRGRGPRPVLWAARREDPGFPTASKVRAGDRGSCRTPCHFSDVSGRGATEAEIERSASLGP